MTHRFSIQNSISGVPVTILKGQIVNPAFHEKVSNRIPGIANLQILQAGLIGRIYVLKREYNLDVNIPDIARKFLKDAFRLKREDDWNIDEFTVDARFSMNMPVEFRSKTFIRPVGDDLFVHQDWEVDVRIPLIHGLLAKHAELEIKRFHQIELAILEDELKAAMN